MATDDSKKYVGMWVTANGQIRQELQANGRYDEARGDKQSAYQGRYEIDAKQRTLHCLDFFSYLVPSVISFSIPKQLA